MSLDKLALALIVVGGTVYLGIILLGMIALFPWGLVGLAVIGIVGFIFIQVLRQRLNSAEDDYYERTIDK